MNHKVGSISCEPWANNQPSIRNSKKYIYTEMLSPNDIKGYTFMNYPVLKRNIAWKITCKKYNYVHEKNFFVFFDSCVSLNCLRWFYRIHQQVYKHKVGARVWSKHPTHTNDSTCKTSLKLSSVIQIFTWNRNKGLHRS